MLGTPYRFNWEEDGQGSARIADSLGFGTPVLLACPTAEIPAHKRNSNASSGAPRHDRKRQKFLASGKSEPPLES
jgi:hypothetical protein